MELISLKEYAELHGVTPATVRQKVLRGGFKTARKIGGVWLIDKSEPYNDKRVTMSSDLMDSVVKDYEKTNSMKETGRLNDISEQKVKKILITKGKYSNALSIQVGNLVNQGLSIDEIGQKLNVSRATVNMYTPYSKTVYNDSPSINAQRIKKTRGK